MTDTQYLDGFVGELLHINEVADNKLIDLGANNRSGTYVLTHTGTDLSAYTLKIIADRIGKTGNTVLAGSAQSGGEQRVSRQINTFEWRTLDGGADVAALHAFITGARKDLVLKGNNPLFLSVGAFKWRTAVRERGKDVLKDIVSPFLIFPVRLVVSSSTQPVTIEFVDDEIYVNPCLIAKFRQVLSDETVDGMPKIDGKSFDLPVDISALGDGERYFAELKAYAESCRGDDDTLFEFDKDFVAISQYKHDELCTYYDIRRNKDKIYSHHLVERLFSRSSEKPREVATGYPAFVLTRDSVQEDIIARAVGGESMIVKGPPGTGKTVTIANMIAALLAENKRVLFASKKISALTEVYAKLPEKLRRFTMLLDSETESKAAKLRPEDIKQEFKTFLAYKREYREPASLRTDSAQAAAERAKTLKAISVYVELMFNGEPIVGESFYNALNAVCKLDMPVIEFAGADEVIAVKREQYNRLLTRVAEAQKNFSLLTGNGAHPVYKSPWFGVTDCNTEEAKKALTVIAAEVESVCAAVEILAQECGLNPDELTLNDVLKAAESALSEIAVRALAEDERCDGLLKNIRRRLTEFNNVQTTGDARVQATDFMRLEGCMIKLGKLKIERSLTVAEIKAIAENSAVLYGADGKKVDGNLLNLAIKVVEETEAAKKQINDYITHSEAVFRQDLTEAERADILRLGGDLKQYFGKNAEKPSLFDFKAKKAYTGLRAYSYLTNPSFAEVVAAVEAVNSADAVGRGLDGLYENLNRIFRKRLSDGERDCVRIIADKCIRQNKNADAFVRSVKEEASIVLSCCDEIEGNADALTVEAIVCAYERAYGLWNLKDALEAFNEVVEVYRESDGGNETEIASSLAAMGSFVAACKEQGASSDGIIKAVELLKNFDVKVKAALSGIVDDLSRFGRDYFRNYYAINGEDNKLGDLKILRAQAADRDVIAAATSYSTIKNDPSNALPLGEFLYWFEKGGQLPSGASFKDAFEHSFFALAVRARDDRLGVLRNGLGNYLEDNLEKLRGLDEKINEYNVLTTESGRLAAINADDDDFIFIQDRNPAENLRLMFKRHGEAVLKLKRCMILSPYTASLLFRTEEFEKFDVLIVDEASQLEPALVLPVLFRSKQCIIVGDEWQMPPIKHFVTLGPVQESADEDGYAALEPEISVLGLALRCENFPVKELVCHYRSKTETLIKFSQKLFYPNMRTFPAPVPAKIPEKGVAGLGIKDVFVENGTVKLGRNEAEAKRVVEELKLHFNNYYDQEKHTLSMSVGVVAFGEAQCSYIESLVNADKELSKKIADAVERFTDLPEKLIFFKTIETVQGQETGHLILSLTHGRRESGLYMHFGQLNQGKLGRCIFNVAVTRAQSMVTVIHSVKASEITGDNISYIRDYLETVERFAGDGVGQFVCGECEKGFVSQVVEFIEGLGVSRDRIICNYGVTDGSVRIPVAILSEDKREALLAVWCEKPVGGKYNFLDYNLRYVNSLKERGWKVHRVSVHDWVDNGETERKQLAEAVKKAVGK